MNTLEISPELQELLDATPPLDELDLEGLAKATRELENDPEHIADYLKGWFVAEIWGAMYEQGITASKLANKWGKSRQYLSKILNEDRRVNFTIDSMVEIMMLLDRRVELHFPRKNEHSMVIRCQKRIPVSDAWSVPEQNKRQPLSLEQFQHSKSKPHLIEKGIYGHSAA